jgi:hypothetical protein
MFVRQQYLDPSNGRSPPRFRPCHFSLADALLRPQLLVDGFLRYCQSIITDRFLFSFAAAPSSLGADEGQFPGLTIKPIPAENCAIPESARVSEANRKDQRVDLWPALHPLEPGSWIVLVSREWHTTQLQRRNIVALAAQGSLDRTDPGLPLVRHAFLRVKERIELPDGPEEAAALAAPEYLEVVGGVKEFLRETAPSFDEGTVDARLDELELAMQEQWPGRRGPRKSFLSVFDEETARSVLGDFLRDAMRVRENLKVAMLEVPEGELTMRKRFLGPFLLTACFIEERWYPELLAGQRRSRPGKRRRVDSRARSSAGSSARGDSVFRTLYDPEAQELVLLGTDTPALPPLVSPYHISDDDDL